eukprot:scaffold2335_cov136-Skeletonema_dohrnii-CCMP3373.AAC.1
MVSSTPLLPAAAAAAATPPCKRRSVDSAHRTAPAIKAGSQTYVSWFARFANTRKVVRQLTKIGQMTCETRDSDRSPEPLAH